MISHDVKSVDKHHIAMLAAGQTRLSTRVEKSSGSVAWAADGSGLVNIPEAYKYLKPIAQTYGLKLNRAKDFRLARLILANKCG